MRLARMYQAPIVAIVVPASSPATTSRRLTLAPSTRSTASPAASGKRSTAPGMRIVKPTNIKAAITGSQRFEPLQARMAA